MGLVYGLILIFSTIVILMGLSGLNGMKKLFEDNVNRSKIIAEIQNARDHEKEYQIDKLANSIDLLNEHMAKTHTLINESKAVSDDSEVSKQLEDIQNNVKLYETNFKNLVDLETSQSTVVEKIENLSESILSQLDTKKEVNIKEATILFLKADALTRQFVYSHNATVVKSIRDFISTCKEKLQGPLYASTYKELTDYEDFIEAYSQLEEKQDQMSVLLASSSQSVVDSGDAMQKHDVERISAEMVSLVRITIILFGLMILLSVVFAIIITRSIKSGIQKAVKVAEKLSDGHLEIQITSTDLQRKDEVGKLLNALSSMVERLRDVVENVVTGADNITSASRQLSESSQLLSQGASEQASSGEEASSSIEEMTANIHQNSENSGLAGKMARQVAQDIQEGSTMVSQTIDAMKQIAGKVSIINDIAFQTNILALNAAVEAARAGEHGKGFGVVASEVRKLAERSQAAAAEINQLASLSLDKADHSGTMLQRLVSEIQKTATLVHEISMASAEENTGAIQLNIAVQQLNEVIQQNAASAEEIATSAEELDSQAEQLHELVSFFKISDKERPGRQPARLPKMSRTPQKPYVKYQPSTSGKSYPKNFGMDDLDNQFERF